MLYMPPRRNLLIGLGGAAATTGGLVDRLALAAPIEAPEITKCGPASIPPTSPISPECCPPFKGVAPVDYVPPPFPRLRVRPPAHAMSPEQIEKYKRATQLMRELPADDPRSFVQQAKVHCAYCNGGYDQVGFPDLELQVHFSWLFFPFHRWYLYFYERILGKLIGDENFAMPYWNWDHPDGMRMPAIFTDPNSTLYNAKRNALHYPPAIADLDRSDDAIPEGDDDEQIRRNLCTMYKSMVSGAKKPELFFGGKYIAGAQPSPGAGTIENVPHTGIHAWVGDPKSGREDMGIFYSAGYDPIFYCHHMNVDRTWELWKKIPGRYRRDIDDPDYLETSFFFYDENARPVRVKIKDCLNAAKLGYKYQDADLPWLSRKPKPRETKPQISFKILQEPTFPLLLKYPISATVKRPQKSRTASQKIDLEEVLVVKDIEVDKGSNAKFDVFINAPDTEALGPEPLELAGGFANVPHRTKKSKKGSTILKTNLKLGITDLLDDIKADDDDSIIVTLVPRKAKNNIKIGGLAIEFA